MKGITVDDDSKVVDVHYAVVYAPRRSRGRFAESCVRVAASAADALVRAEPQKKWYAARVIGPSKSSEGQRVYYLDDWLG